MTSMWWKFSVGSSGSHLFRVQDPGGPNQMVWLDGEALEAPPGTLTFTGPAATLMELQNTDSGWILLADGRAVERYCPDGPLPALPEAQDGESPAATSSSTWFRFSLPGRGTHHLRVTNIGQPSQAVYLDAAPLEAPPGTMTFTGPAASLLEIQFRDRVWVLMVDGTIVHPYDPNMDGAQPVTLWSFSLPSTGQHTVRVFQLGRANQTIELDGQTVAAPPGTTTFTGPEATLLQLAPNDEGQWILYVDGTPLAASTDGEWQTDHLWTFMAPQTGTAHQLKVSSMGRVGQEVVLDGVVLPAPEGTTMFTGPGGCLLELRPADGTWLLLVDGACIEEFNTRSSTFVDDSPGGQLSSEKRSPVATAEYLPQGVSQDPETGLYTANIRVGGRFRSLGEFSTPKEAHERYLEAKKEAGL